MTSKFKFHKRASTDIGISKSATPMTEDDDNSDADDDDDFKPQKANPLPGKKKAKGSTTCPETTTVPVSDFSFEDDPSVSEQVDHGSRSSQEDACILEEASKPLDFMPLIKEEADVDDIIVLETVEGKGQKAYPETSTTDTKSAWKNLMDKMQKNQQTVNSLGTVKKKFKPSVKRGLALSPKLKGSKSTKSPSKKNPKLANSSISDSQRLDVPVRDTWDTVNLPSVTENSFKQEYSTSTDRKALTDANASGRLTKNDRAPSSASSKKDVKIAPLFLPPSERKALQQPQQPLKKETSTVRNINEGIMGDVLSFVESCTHEFNAAGDESSVENPDHFAGNIVILNDEKIEKDPYGGTKTKVCPFYKKLPGVPFCVDAFNYGLIPGMEVYFLSHFHSDHYIGLTKKFCKTLICSLPTGNLVRMKLYVEDKYIRKLALNKPYEICDTEVTLIDANHCPGSVMFIFRMKSGQTILHTGDFRFTPDMLSNPFMLDLKVNNLYLDTTYCSPEYDFPTQSESIANVITFIQRHLEFRPKTLILCGSYVIGKERVCFTLAEAMRSKVFANYDKRKVINALNNSKFSGMLTSDENSCKIHVVSMFSLGAKNLREYLTKYPQFTNIIGIKPSGWQFSSAGSGCSVKTHYGDTVTVLGVPYSEHSSFSELKEFVTRLRPNRVQPTVNVGNAKKREGMMRYIDGWTSQNKES